MFQEAQKSIFFFFVCRKCGVPDPSRGKQHVGQTGRCLNDGLREHARNAMNGRDGFLALHCGTCVVKGCKPDFQKSFVTGKSKSRLTHEIIEAEKICRVGPEWVSTLLPRDL